CPRPADLRGREAEVEIDPLWESWSTPPRIEGGERMKCRVRRSHDNTVALPRELAEAIGSPSELQVERVMDGLLLRPAPRGAVREDHPAERWRAYFDWLRPGIGFTKRELRELKR